MGRLRRTDLPATLVAAAWAFLTWIGIQGLNGILTQHVLGYPAAGQFILYIGIPLLALALLGISRSVSRQNHWSWAAYPVTTFVTGFALLPTLMFWGGGV